MLKILVILTLTLGGLPSGLITGLSSVAFGQVSEDAFNINSIDLPNFQTVIQSQIYRGGAPTAQGLHNLASAGIKTIVDLRNEDPQGSAAEKSVATSVGMHYISVPLNPFAPPPDQTMNAIESNLLSDPNLRPIFVHCHYGEDRTGLVFGLFRVFKQTPAYTPAQAYAEMLHYGFHPQLKNLADYFFTKTNWHP